MVISDGANMRTVVYSSAGILKDSDPWTEVIKPDGRKSYSHKKYLLGCCFAGYGGTGNLWIDRKGAYMSFDNRGNPFQSASTRPLELGVTSFRYIAGVTAENRCRSVHYYEYAVEYPDAVYIFDECQEDFKSDLSGPVRVFDNLIMDNHQGSIYVYRVMRTFPALEGRKQKRYLEWIATWRKPEDEFGPPRMVCLERLANLTAEYGDPVIGPDGSVYSWKRTPTNYKILKWTWKN